MVFGSENKQYRTIREVYHGKKNDVVVCQDLQAAGTLHKTVWIVKDRELVRRIIQLFGNAECMYEACFSFAEGMCFVFPYEQERSLDKFYLATIENGICTRGQVWTQLVMKCMTSGLPAPLLYLILKERQIKLGQDGNIRFQYSLNLDMLDEKKTTADCVAECARILRELMDSEHVRSVAAELLEHRLKRQSYEQFIDLYKDVRLIMQESEKKSEKKTLGRLVGEKQDLLYRIVLVVCIIFVVIAVVLFLGKLAFGDASVYQLFRHSIEQIGTESLLQ